MRIMALSCRKAYDVLSIITALHAMQRGIAMRILSVRLSVCLSVKRVICDKMEERSVQIFIPYERSFRL